jgi:hypothetical protein
MVKSCLPPFSAAGACTVFCGGVISASLGAARGASTPGLNACSGDGVFAGAGRGGVGAGPVGGVDIGSGFTGAMSPVTLLALWLTKGFYTPFSPL